MSDAEARVKPICNTILDAIGDLALAGAPVIARRAGESALLTYKGPATIRGGVKSRREIDEA